QQHNDRCRDRLMKSAAANFSDGIGQRAMAQVADGQLLQHGQHDQQSEEDKRPVQRGPDESFFLVPLTEMKHVSYAEEFGTNQSLDGGETEGSKDDALRLKDGSLQIGEGREADIKIGRDNQEFLQLVGCSFTDRYFCCSTIHVSLHRRSF